MGGSLWVDGERVCACVSKGEARVWMGGRALLASEILLREGAPKVWAKEGKDCGG